MIWAKRGWVIALASCTVLAVLGISNSASAASASPAWSITVASYPTNFVPKESTIEAGPGYLILATNVGGAATSGKFTVTDTLPTGVTVSPSTAPKGVFGREKVETKLFCSAAGQTVTCTGAAPGVSPGERVQVNIPVKLSATLPESLTDEASISGGGAPSATTASTLTTVSSTPATFGFLQSEAGFYGAANNADGSPSKLAGSHPYQLTVGLGFPSIPAEAEKGNLFGAGGGLRDASVVLPPGMVVDPGAVAQCKESELETVPSNCPQDSQVGTVRTTLSIASVNATVSPLYNMKTSPGSPGEFGFEPGGLQGTYIHLRGHVLSNGDYELSAGATDTLAKVGVLGVQTNLWGVPSAESHDAQRGPCFSAPFDGLREGSLCPTEHSTGEAFLSMPSACSNSLTARALADSWLEPGMFGERSAGLTAADEGVQGCENLDFGPTIELKPDETDADSPSGLTADLHVPQSAPVEERPGVTDSCGGANWLNKPTALAYQWLRDGVPIGNATSKTYLVEEADAGATLQCEVSARRTTTATANVEAGSQVLKSVLLENGEFHVGEEISGSGIPAGSVIKAILGEGEVRAEQKEKGESEEQGEIPRRLEISQPATASGSRVTVATPPSAPGLTISAPRTVPAGQAGGQPIPGVPRISGNLGPSGGSVSCEPGTWEGNPTFSYEWFRNGAPAAGQNSETYSVGAAELPITLQCKVIGSNSAGAAVAISSSLSSSPGPVPVLPEPYGPPQIGFTESDYSLATATLKDAKITLPAGVSVDPSAANGRGACTAGQVGLVSPVGQGTDIHFRDEPANCPDDAKLGTVEVLTPLLRDEPESGKKTPHPLDGSVYLAEPYENPFHSLLALYIVVYDPETGVVVKLAGEVQADPATGQLTTTFRENPQLPFEDFKLSFTGGPRAALRTPITCGSYSSHSEFTSWANPSAISEFEPFPVEHGASGSTCIDSTSQLPNNPGFQAGASSPKAGEYSPFVMGLSRQDGSQELGALNVTLPPGLTGRLVGTPYCSESALAAAATKSGREEEASPSCPSDSRVGTITVGAGAGPQPYYAHGTVYLAGRYKGAPLSLAIVTPAVAGPFDLGDVVVRAALSLNLYTSQITVKSDPIPNILKGIPLDIRSVAVQVDKPDFALNPTNCEPMAIGAQAISTTGNAASLSNRFQVTGCENLAFKPSFSASTSAKTSRKNGASLHVALTYPKDSIGTDANIKSARVELPKALPSRLSTLNHACVASVFNQNPADCPSESRVGIGKAVTPLLPVPLEGPAYFVSHGGAKFPELIVVLQGYGITVYLAGETFISKAGITSSTFKTVPDVPVESFELTLPQGPYSALAANTNLCTASLTMPTTFNAQNGATIRQNTQIEPQGCPYTLGILGHSVNKRTLTLKVSVPAAGRLVATGKNVSTAAQNAKGRQTLTLKLKERQAGKLHTNITLRFTPTHTISEQRGKKPTILHKSLTVTFP